MAPTYLHPVSASFFHARPAGGPPPSLRAFLRSVYAAIVTARTRQAEREIARFIERNGGRLTDELERKISSRFGSIAGDPRRAPRLWRERSRTASAAPAARA